MPSLTPEEFSHIASAIQSLATVLALLVGGAWTYRRFIKRREEHARLSFDPVIRFVTETEKSWIAEVVAQIENKGEVRHTIRVMRYELTVCTKAPTEFRATSGSIATLITSTNVESRSWLPEGCEYIFVEPGVKSDYYAAVSIPKTAQLVCLRGFFTTGEGDEYFFGERLFAPPQPTELKGELSLPPSVHAAGA